MSIFIIKIIACITMVLDHIKYAIPITKGFVTRYFGRISFPLFAFLIGEGYYHTSDLKKYYKRLIIFAIISQIPFMLFRTMVGEWKMLNVMFTLLLGLISINIFDKLGKKYYISLPIVLILSILGNILRVDYGWYGVLSVFVLYIFRENKFLRFTGFFILNLIYYYKRNLVLNNINNIILFGFSVFPTILLFFYNGKLGKKVKYLYYIFYPAHMILLYFLGRFNW